VATTRLLLYTDGYGIRRNGFYMSKGGNQPADRAIGGLSREDVLAGNSSYLGDERQQITVDRRPRLIQVNRAYTNFPPFVHVR
jgi:hypothetical protein